jgi:hypothetical protein
MWRGISKTLRELLEIPGYRAGAYRPDKHYMRGPGPCSATSPNTAPNPALSPEALVLPRPL